MKLWWRVVCSSSPGKRLAVNDPGVQVSAGVGIGKLATERITGENSPIFGVAEMERGEVGTHNMFMRDVVGADGGLSLMGTVEHQMLCGGSNEGEKKNRGDGIHVPCNGRNLEGAEKGRESGCLQPPMEGNRLADVVGSSIEGMHTSLLGKNVADGGVQSSLRKSFVEATRGHRVGRLPRKVDVILNSEVGVVMSDELAEIGMKRWHNALVCGVLGRRIPRAIVEQNIHRIWKDCGVMEVLNAGSRMLFVRFSDDKKFEHILSKGDWNIVGCPLMVRRWTIGMTLESLEPSKLPLWVKLRDVPCVYHHFEGIEDIASSLGNPLRIDSNLNSKDGIRVQIESTAADSIQRSLRLIGAGGNGVEVKVEYEFFLQRFDNCRVFGHDLIHCPKAKAEGKVTMRREIWREFEKRKGVRGRENANGLPRGCEAERTVLSKSKVTLHKNMVKEVGAIRQNNEEAAMVKSTFDENAPIEQKGIPVGLNPF